MPNPDTLQRTADAVRVEELASNPKAPAGKYGAECQFGRAFFVNHEVTHYIRRQPVIQFLHTADFPSMPRLAFSACALPWRADSVYQRNAAT